MGAGYEEGVTGKFYQWIDKEVLFLLIRIGIMQVVEVVVPVVGEVVVVLSPLLLSHPPKGIKSLSLPYPYPYPYPIPI